MLVGVHTRVTEGRQTIVGVVGALFADWLRDETIWLVKYVSILSSIRVRMPESMCLCNCPAGCPCVLHPNLRSTSTIRLIDYVCLVLTPVMSRWVCLRTNQFFAPVTSGNAVRGI